MKSDTKSTLALHIIIGLHSVDRLQPCREDILCDTHNGMWRRYGETVEEQVSSRVTPWISARLYDEVAEPLQRYTGDALVQVCHDIERIF